MSRARLTPAAWDAELPVIRADSFAQPIVKAKNLWAIFTPSLTTGALFVGTEEQVKGTLSEGGRIEFDGLARWVIVEPF
jgi:hypothetical protein